jgi:hypothetical protein
VNCHILLHPQSVSNALEMIVIPSCRLAKRKAEMLVSPKFHVSRTRLIIYNLPKTMTINDVKKLCREAVISRATKQNPVIRKVYLGFTIQVSPY